MDPVGNNEKGNAPTMKDFNLILGIVIGIAVVCGLGFITLLFTYYQQSAASYEGLKDQIITQDAEIQNLSTQLEKN